MITAVAEDAAKAGYAVTVITSARGYNLEQTYPSFEKHEQIAIVRVRGTGWNRHSSVGRLGNYLSFLLFSAFELLCLPKPDCLVVTTAPPFSLLLAVVARLCRRVPFVYVIEDLYPEIAFVSGLVNASSRVGGLILMFFGWMMSQASATIVLGHYMKQRVMSSHPSLNEKTIYPIHNWQDGSLIYPLGRERQNTNSVLLQYSGNLGEAHDFDTLLAAIKLLPREVDIKFEFVGRGRKLSMLKDALAQNQLSQCQIKDYVPQERLNESLNQADVCLVTLAKGYEGLIVPSKIYGIMAAGKPVIFIGALEGEIPSLIREHESGWVVEQGDVSQLTKVILLAAQRADLRKQLGNNARRAFETHYERSLATAKYIQIFDSVTKTGQ